MNFKEHSELEGQHAFLGASKYHWLNYDEEHLVEAYRSFKAIQRGTELHDFAKQCVKLGVKLKGNKETLPMYVNDAIAFKMTPEQPLFYSFNSYGQADAISFRNNFLRIHDLKTGTTKASMKQLAIYAALFCLEYGINPEDIETELRIYQNNSIIIDNPQADAISEVMEKITTFDKVIEDIKMEV